MTVSDGVAAALIDHARAAAPQECCGLLIGDEQHVTAALPARNVADHPERHYTVAPQDHLHAIRLARASGKQVIGAYHSHPRSQAVPSATDTAEAFAHFLFVIVGLGADPPELRAWTLTDGNFVCVPFVPVP